MPPLNTDTFHSTWGTGSPDTGAEAQSRSLDPKAFESQWLTSAPEPPQKVDTSGLNATMNAGLGSAVDAIPFIGPWLKSNSEKIGAHIRSKIYGTDPKDELEFVRNANAQNVEAHPVASAVGQVSGAVLPMIAGAAAAPAAFGMTGPLWQRAAAGGITNALINGGDTAVRTGDKNEALTSAAVGGGIASALPVAGKALGIAGNAMFGSGDGAVNALARRAEAMGIPIRFSQTTGSPFISKLSQMAGKLPGSGMGALQGEQQVSFNRAVAKTFGEDADRITPDVMAAAKKRIGSDFDDVANGTVIKVDTPLLTDLHQIVNDAQSTVAGSELTVLNKQLSNILDKVTGSGEIDGKAYQGLTRTGTPLNRAMKSDDSNVRFYAEKIKEALDDALERSAPTHLSEKLTKARSQYKAMKTIEDLSEKSPTGDISPALLMNPVRQSYGNMAYGGGGELADLARIGQRFMKAPADSGTPLGIAALHSIPGGAGLLGGGLAGYYSGWDPTTMAEGALALPLTAMGARGITTLLNRPQSVNALMQRIPMMMPAANQLSLSPPQ